MWKVNVNFEIDYALLKHRRLNEANVSNQFVIEIQALMTKSHFFRLKVVIETCHEQINLFKSEQMRDWFIIIINQNRP